ncbi:glycosyltransferase family 4 protein [[Eubacterium] cellulosolvens]
MRVAMVRTTLHKGSGQVVHITELAKRLRKKGVQINIFTRECWEDLSPIKTVKVEFKGSSLPFIRHFGFMARSSMLIKEFDIVHTQYHPGVFTGNFVRTLRKIPHVFTFHGYAPMRSWQNPKQKLKMFDHTLGTIIALHAGVDRIIAISYYIQDILTRFYKFDQAKISVVYNGVDIERFQPNIDGSSLKTKYNLDDSPTILYLGRMDPYKGVQFLLRALPLVLEKVPNAKFIIAGATRFDRIRVQDFVLSKKIRNSLIFTGYVSEAEVPLLYAICDMFCYPSLWEGFGLTPAEAQASGKPVVAFNHCAIPEVVKNNETGILVEPKDDKKMAEAIIKLLKDMNLRKFMGNQGRKRVERHFTWDLSAKKTFEVYQNVVEDKGINVEN